jgi:hypothetical protein
MWHAWERAEKPERKKLGRLRLRWEDGVRIDLSEIDWGCGVDSIFSGWGPVRVALNTAVKDRVLTPRS